MVRDTLLAARNLSMIDDCEGSAGKSREEIKRYVRRGHESTILGRGRRNLGEVTYVPCSMKGTYILHDE